MASNNEEEILTKIYCMNKKKIEETKKNKKLFKALLEIYKETGLTTLDVDRSKGVLLFKLGTSYPKKGIPQGRGVIASYITNGKVGALQFPHAIDFFTRFRGEFDANALEAFEKHAGVGVEPVTKEAISKVVAHYFDKYAEEINRERYRMKPLLSTLIRHDERLKFAAARDVFACFNGTLTKLLGKPTKQDRKQKGIQTLEALEAANAASSSSGASSSDAVVETLPSCVEYPPPEENYQKNPALLEQHLKQTGGKIITRFPPEPNGYLHVGHSKAANLDFGYAMRKGGDCILRFDDTNPTTESQEYADSIIENIDWLGFKPSKITYSSDYFEKLYQLGEDLIRRGYGYVCFCPSDKISSYREQKKECDCRSAQTNEKNLKMFQGMKDGLYKEGECCMRMKCDMKHENTTLRDPVAYRIIYASHIRSGDKWCIYPSYDFTHCIVDSLENITHSLCSLEFSLRREAYEWLLNVLDLYCPPQREFARLNIEHTVLSKRKLIKLVESGVVSGWDDPRLPTMMGIRRKGYPPQALLKFCNMLSITRTDTLIDVALLELNVRRELEPSATRGFAVLNPLKVVVDNWDPEKVEPVPAPIIPGDDSAGERLIPFSKVLYIERKDFRSTDKQDYYGLAPGKEVRLRYCYIVECVGFDKDADGNVTCVHVVCKPDAKSSPKGVIHWVAQPEPGVEPHTAELRLYDNLFKSPDPSALGDDWLKDVNPNALVVRNNVYIEPSLYEATESFIKASEGAKRTPLHSFQFERVGFFCFDKDTTPSHPVFNKTVGLRNTYKPNK